MPLNELTSLDNTGTPDELSAWLGIEILGDRTIFDDLIADDAGEVKTLVVTELDTIEMPEEICILEDTFSEKEVSLASDDTLFEDAVSVEDV